VSGLTFIQRMMRLQSAAASFEKITDYATDASVASSHHMCGSHAERRTRLPRHARRICGIRMGRFSSTCQVPSAWQNWNQMEYLANKHACQVLHLEFPWANAVLRFCVMLIYFQKVAGVSCRACYCQRQVPGAVVRIVASLALTSTRQRQQKVRTPSIL
jgi:hypothetical protein